MWQPKLGATEKHVEDATRLITDDRATHYWDGPGSTLRSYRKTLAIAEDAWDIYLIYGPEAVWEGALPPRPVLWMHQLGTVSRPRVDAPYLDSSIFSRRVDALLGKVQAAVELEFRVDGMRRINGAL